MVGAVDSAGGLPEAAAGDSMSDDDKMGGQSALQVRLPHSFITGSNNCILIRNRNGFFWNRSVGRLDCL